MRIGLQFSLRVVELPDTVTLSADLGRNLRLQPRRQDGRRVCATGEMKPVSTQRAAVQASVLLAGAVTRLTGNAEFRCLGVDDLRKKKIVASVTPYKTLYARLSPGLLNSPAEVETTLAAVRELSG